MKSIGIAIERYWWMRASVIGCASTSAPCGSEGSCGGSPFAILFALPARISTICFSVRPDARAVRSAMTSEPGCWP